MLKLKKFNILCLFTIIGCLQNKNNNEMLMKVMEKPLPKYGPDEDMKRIFQLIKNLREDEFINEIERVKFDIDNKYNFALQESGYTMLAWACKVGSIKIVKHMLTIKKFEDTINEKSLDGYTPLMILTSTRFPFYPKMETYETTFLKKFELIELLLKHKPDVHLRDNEGFTAYYRAWKVFENSSKEERGDAYKIIALLKQEGADIEDMIKSRKPDGEFKKIFETLCEKNPEIREKLTFDSLVSAIHELNINKVFLCLNLHNANPNNKIADDENTAMHIACIKLFDSVSPVAVQIIKQLYKQRTIGNKLIWGKIDVENKKGETPIGLYLSHLLHSAFNYSQIFESADASDACKRAMFSKIQAFMSIVNYEKDIYLKSQVKCIIKEIEAQEETMNLQDTGDPATPIQDEILLTWTKHWAENWAIPIKVTELKLLEIFKHSVTLKTHVAVTDCKEIDCGECAYIRKLKAFNIFLEMLSLKSPAMCPIN